MKNEQVDAALRRKFIDEGHPVVFWEDPKAEFGDYIAAGLPAELEGVEVVRIGIEGNFAIKHNIGRLTDDRRLLLYEARQRPPASADLLLDIRHLAEPFTADITTIWLEELGLNRRALRPHLEERSAFLRSKERRARLARLLPPSATERAIDLAMIAVLVGEDVPSLAEIVVAIADGHAADGVFPLGEEPDVLAALGKMGLTESFWASVSKEFSYSYEGGESFHGLLRAMMVSEFHQRVGRQVPQFAHFELPPTGRQNAVVCLTKWRDSAKRSESYAAAALAVEKELSVAGHLSGFDLNELLDAHTFFAVDQVIAQHLRDELIDPATPANPEQLQDISARRLAGPWWMMPGPHSETRDGLRHAHDAFGAASQLFALHQTHAGSFSFGAPGELLSAYASELFGFDQEYRRFHYNASIYAKTGGDLLKGLAVRVEDVYDHSWVEPLGLEWSEHLEASFLADWKVEGWQNQHRFFEREIKPFLDERDDRRAFVIISDAFRYEAAEDLTQRVNGREGLASEMVPMLGVLPSYTKLGMASLLPHASLEYTDAGDVLVDGRSVSSTEARNTQLGSVDGMACKATELLKLKTDAARDLVKDQRVVYIYHNVVDARGDQAATEEETFPAVEQCIQELLELIKFCVNRMNAARVWVTADHGFLFQQPGMEQIDKTGLKVKPKDAVSMKKRYVIGRSLGMVREAHAGRTDRTAGTSDAMEYWVPKGANRFHLAGGARFVHGGAMPQEIVVPLVRVSRLRGQDRKDSEVRKVSVQVLGTNHKITTAMHRFEFIQTEAVSDRRRPLTAQVAVYQDLDPVTSVEQVVFDSSSGALDDRKRESRLTLKAKDFSKTEAYRLVLRDAATGVEIQSVPVVIDRSFASDF